MRPHGNGSKWICLVLAGLSRPAASQTHRDTGKSLWQVQRGRCTDNSQHNLPPNVCMAADTKTRYSA